MSLTAVSEKKAAVLDATRAFGVMLGGALILAVAAAASVGEHFIMERKMLLGIKERAERARKEESR